MVMERFDGDLERFRNAFSPEMVDSQIRQAVQTCWMMLPAERHNVAGVTAEIRRIVERALGDLAEDTEHFGCE